MTSTIRPGQRLLLTLLTSAPLALLLVVLTLAPAGWTLLMAGAATEGGAGTWQWPLQPTPAVERGFEPPTDPWGPGHRGVDLTGRVGEAVLAVDDGTVSFAGYVGGRGVVAVRHGELRSTYQPVVPSVRAGDHIDVGEALGRLTQVGSHCLPATCLHLGARRDQQYLDPLALLGGVEIRLKPLQPPPSEGVGAPGELRPPQRRQEWRALTEALSSGARVGLTVGRSQALRGDVRIDLGGGERRVSEQLLHGPEVRSPFEEVRGR